MFGIRRREFIALFGGAAAWPLAVSAQQVRRVAILMGVADQSQGRAAFETFRQGLEALGWTEGRNLTIDLRWADGNTETMLLEANELINRRPDVIIVRGSRALMAVQRRTSSIPVVFISLSDPVGLGFIKSMARPGGHITGFTVFEVTLVAKLLELLKQIAPHTNRALLLYHPDNTSAVGYHKSFEDAAHLLGVTTTTTKVKTAAEIENAIERFAGEPNGGLIAAPDVFLASRGDTITGLAARFRLAGVYPYRDFVPGGGLLFYGPDI